MTTLALRTRPRRLVLAVLLVLCSALAGMVTLASTAASDTLPAHHESAVRTVTKIRPLTVPATRAAPVTTAVPAPAPTVVRLRAGDTLWGLAQRYGTTVAALQHANGLGNTTLIYAGQPLHLPTTGPAAPAPVRATATLTSASATGTVRQAAASIFGTQYGCAAQIITRESGWNLTATNRSSGAYGLAQALPGAKMATAGADWRTDPATQLRWMRSYVTDRYGGACGAWAFWQAHAWY